MNKNYFVIMLLVCIIISVIFKDYNRLEYENISSSQVNKIISEMNIGDSVCSFYGTNQDNISEEVNSSIIAVYDYDMKIKKAYLVDKNYIDVKIINDQISFSEEYFEENITSNIEGKSWITYKKNEKVFIFDKIVMEKIDSVSYLIGGCDQYATVLEATDFEYLLKK